MPTPSRTERVAVVGAGVAGLILARDLVRDGHEVSVFDKGRGPGGRLATRRAEPFSFDHGAQYFTARDPEFRAEVETWVAAGCAARWNGRLTVLEAPGITAPGITAPGITAPGITAPGITAPGITAPGITAPGITATAITATAITAPGDASGFRREGTAAVGASDERFVGVPGMNRIAHTLAEQLATCGPGRGSIARGVRVATIATSGQASPAALDGGPAASPRALDRARRPLHLLRDEQGNSLGTFELVLVTTPPEQAAPLVAASPRLHGLASAIAMNPCWATMVAFAEPLAAPFDGAFVHGGPLAWICRDGSKPGRSAPNTWVLHASAAWSRAHLEEDADDVVRASLEALRATLGIGLPELLYSAAHRWRYAGNPATEHMGAPFEPALDRALDRALGLGLAGDWLCGSNVQSAWRSARSLATRIRSFDH